MSKQTTEEPREGRRSVNRRAFLQMSAAATTGVAVGGALPEIAAAQESPGASGAPMSKNNSISHSIDGHLYMQTNEVKNAIIHYHRSANGTLTEVERVATGGVGSGPISPIYHVSRPNDLEGAGCVRLTPDRRFLFATTAGDNSVSSFAVHQEGQLTLHDGKPTGNTQIGGANSVAYAASSHMLCVVHTVSPDDLRLMPVDDQGNLTPRPEQYSMNTKDWPNRMPTMAVLSPNAKFLLVGTTFDELPSRKNPDGSLILWIPHGEDGALHVIASNAPHPNGIVVFRAGRDGTLGERSFNDAGGASPFFLAFLQDRPDTLLTGCAVSNGVSMASFEQDGRIRPCPIVQLDRSAGLPSELCWLSVSPDDKMVYTTNFGYSDVSSYRVDGNMPSIAKDPRAQRSGVTAPSERLTEPLAAARVTAGFRRMADTSTRFTEMPPSCWVMPLMLAVCSAKITNAKVPYNSPQGLAGFLTGLDGDTMTHIRKMPHVSGSPSARPHHSYSSHTTCLDGRSGCDAASVFKLTHKFVPFNPSEAFLANPSDKHLQRANGSGRIIVTGSEREVRIIESFQQSPIRILFPKTSSSQVEEAVILNTAGGTAGGDRLEHVVTALSSASIAVTSQAAEKVYQALSEPARVRTKLTACDTAKLAWLPQETIVFNRARLRRETEIDVASGAELLALEWLVLGRAAHGEDMVAGEITDSWRVKKSGRLVWADSFRITDHMFPHLRRRALLWDHRAFATVVYFGKFLDKSMKLSRELSPSLECDCATTSVAELMIVRFAAKASSGLRSALRNFLERFSQEFSPGPFQVPKMWSC